MSKFKNKFYFALILIVLGICTRLFTIGYPSEVVFDETYFGKYASEYLSGKYYFDPHPPLGKLLISGMGYAAGNRVDNTDYSKIGSSYDSNIYIWYRLLPILAGILLPLMIFLIVIQLSVAPVVAFASGLLIIFENSLVTQSHFISIDSLLYLFGFSSLWLYLLYKKSKDRARKTYFILSMVTATLALSIKWTGLSFAGLIFLIELYEFRSIINRFIIKSLVKKIAVFLVIGSILYLSFFVVHFALLPKSGQGNDFMTPSFQKTLSGNKYSNDPSLEAPSFIEKFAELNKEMLASNIRMNASHPYSSKWYTWPFMVRPIFYWEGAISSGDAVITERPYIYLIGNPIIYWFSFVSIVIVFFHLFLSFLFSFGIKFFKRLAVSEDRKFALVFIALGFLINFLPFALIGRVMFLYHYGAALVFSIIALVIFMDTFCTRKKRNIYLGTLVFISVCSFIFFAPLTYGVPLSDSQLNMRIWLSSWR